MLRVAVKDTGIGMRREMLPVVFDLFVQGRQGLDRSEGGLGLGLSIVKSLVTLHHGTVEAHSNGPGKGSEFVVLLAGDDDVARDGGCGHGHRRRAGAPAEPAGRRVLLVDDNEDAVASLAEALSDLGHAVEVAHDGPEALAKLRDVLPRHRAAGHRAAADGRLRAGPPHPARPRLAGIRLVSISGYGQPSDKLRAREAGFDDYLVKPVDLGVIEKVIADVRGSGEAPN